MHGIVRLRLRRYKQLKHKTPFLMATHRTFEQKFLSEDPIIEIPCFESQGKYYDRVYCHLMCRRDNAQKHARQGHTTLILVTEKVDKTQAKMHLRSA